MTVIKARCPCRFEVDDPRFPLAAWRYPSPRCIVHNPNWWPRCEERRAACGKHLIDLYYDSFGSPYCPECDEEP